MLRCALLWLFQNRKTGAITIAQAPNLALWTVIVAGGLIWGFRPTGRLHIAFEIVFYGALLFWGLDEVFRGVNPWRRCLGVGVVCYEIVTLLI
jgi:hypothetical protein